MKAITYSQYGSPDVLTFGDIDEPSAGEGEVSVRVRAAAANPYDWHFMRGVPYVMRLFIGLRKPKNCRLGVDFAGEVEAVGRDVTQFSPGDEVFGMHTGAFAEFLCVPVDRLELKPTNLTFEQAAAVPLAALTALQGLRDVGRLQPTQRVLIIGASGGVGTFAVQIAKSMGAHVTGVCSTKNLELVHALGADHVIDYTTQDFKQSAQKFGLILQLAGTHSPSHCRSALAPQGVLVLSSGDSSGRWLGPVSRLVKAAVLSPFVSQRLVSLDTQQSQKDLQTLTRLLEAGQIAPVIDRTYPLSEVADAIRYLELGHVCGKVIISV